MSVAVVSVSWGWLADGNHLGVTLLLVRNLNSLGSCGFSLLLVRVGADLVVDLLNALGTDGTGDWVALLYINNDLDGKLNWVADSLESRGANFSRFNNILNRAVVLGLLITIVGLVVSWSRGMIGWGMVDWMVGNRSMVNSMVGNDRSGMYRRHSMVDRVATKGCEGDSWTRNHKGDKSY